MACDLVITSVTPVAPTTAAGNGSVEIYFTTASTLVNFTVTGPVNENFGLVYAGSGVVYGNYALPPGGPYTYTLTQQDDDTCVATGTFDVPAFVPVPGCTDEYAANFDPAATVSNNSCTYSPLWRSAWQPLAVRVAAQPGQTAAFIAATLRAGFRAGHPLAAVRPLVDVATLRATVGPDGYATFVLGPYLRDKLGAPDNAGGYRLDINQETVDDFYVGYELRRADGTLLEHGYAVNAAVPDSFLVTGFILSAFAQVPTWPGYSWKRAQLASRSAGLYGAIDELYPPIVTLPCPPNPLPVAWLNPQGGWDFWVFQGRPQLADEVGDGQTYTEASTGQRRYSQRGEARGTVTASSGVFNGPRFAEGLRTLWASPQVWYQPVPGGEWVAVTLASGSFPVRRMGLARTEVSITLTEALPHYAQGQ